MADLDTKTAKVEETDAIKEDQSIVTMSGKELGKHAIRTWQQLESSHKRYNREMKINYATWRGIKFAQVHPMNPDQIYVPPAPHSFESQSFNEIERAVDRYVTQILADDPIMIAQPKKQTDDSLDAAEAATMAIEGEWDRLNLETTIFNMFLDSCIFRSSYAHIFWNPRSTTTTATKFEKNEDGTTSLQFVNSDGDVVDEKKDAARISQGNLEVEKIPAFWIRHTKGQTVDEAEEITMARFISLRKAIDMYPDLKKVEIGKLVHKPQGAALDELEDYAGKSDKTSSQVIAKDSSVVGTVGDLEDQRKSEQLEKLLNERVFFLIYYRRKNRAAKSGVWAHVFGDGEVPADAHGTLKKWKGDPPVLQLRCLYDPVSEKGRSLVDVLKSKQDILDFLETQFLDWMTTLKTRWMVHSLTAVNPDALTSHQHDDIIYYDGANTPTQTTAPQFPTALFQMLNAFLGRFEDASGMHGPTKGQHVAGVQSGAHVQALQAADQNVLSLSRREVKPFLERLSELLLRGMQAHWTERRQVSFFGRNRMFVQRAFQNTDFEGVEKVRLAPGSLLMITPAQRSAIMNQLVELQVFDAMDLRRLYPTSEVGGFRLQEDPHWQKARRENEFFKAGPPDAVLKSWRAMEKEIKAIQTDMQGSIDDLQKEQQKVADNPQAAQNLSRVLEEIQQQFDAMIQSVQGQFQTFLTTFLPEILPHEQAIEISVMHFEEHARALSTEKMMRLKRKYPWWFDALERHARQHAEVAGVAGIAQPLQTEGEAPPPDQGQSAPTQAA
jgi:hypothetical protein